MTNYTKVKELMKRISKRHEKFRKKAPELYKAMEKEYGKFFITTAIANKELADMKKEMQEK